MQFLLPLLSLVFAKMNSLFRCSRYCSERFRLTQCLEILCANVDDADIIKLVVGITIALKIHSS